MNTISKPLKETTSMAVYRHLYHCILTGYFQPGEWIRERQIKEMLGVSSTPIREALKMLVQERILESVPHHGVRMKALSLNEIKDVYEVRAEMEGLAAQLASIRGDKKQFEKMEELLRISERKLEKNSYIHDTESLVFNNEFHDFIVEVSGNLVLKNALSQLRAGINLIQVLSWKSNRERSSVTLKQHRLILEAIMARNPKLARKRTQEHVWDSVRLVLQSAKEMNHSN